MILRGRGFRLSGPMCMRQELRDSRENGPVQNELQCNICKQKQEGSPYLVQQRLRDCIAFSFLKKHNGPYHHGVLHIGCVCVCV